MDTLIKTIEAQIKQELSMVEHYQKESDKYLRYRDESKAKAETLQTELINLQELVKKDEPGHIN